MAQDPPYSAADLERSRKMQKLAARVAKVLRDTMGETLGFGIVVFPFVQTEEELKKLPMSHYQYVSNCDRAAMHVTLKALVAKWDAGHDDTPPHKKS